MRELESWRLEFYINNNTVDPTKKKEKKEKKERATESREEERDAKKERTPIEKHQRIKSAEPERINFRLQGPISAWSKEMKKDQI